MLRAGKRDSIISWNPSRSSRFSVSTQGSGNGRISMVSARASVYSGISPATPTGDSVSFLKDREGSSRASVISKLSDTDETAEEPDDPSPKVSISLEDGREFDLDTAEGSDTLVSTNSLPSSETGMLPPVKFPSESLSESIGDGFAVDEDQMTFSTASKRMSLITELRSKKDISDAVSLLTVDEITAEVENKQHESDEEDEEEYEEDDEEDEEEEDEEDGDEVELELHDADEPRKPITSHAGLLLRSPHSFSTRTLNVIPSRNRDNDKMDQGRTHWCRIIWPSIPRDGRRHWSFDGCKAGVITDGIWSQSGTEKGHAKRARERNRASP